MSVRRSINTALPPKHLPMVALYWFEKRLLTYWFMSEVLPTLRYANRKASSLSPGAFGRSSLSGRQVVCANGWDKWRDSVGWRRCTAAKIPFGSS